MASPSTAQSVYARYQPSPQLAPYVEHIWTMTAPREDVPRKEILIPNGRPMLLLSFAGPSVRIDPLTGARLLNGNRLFGITSQPYIIEQTGASNYIGVQFRPYGLSALQQQGKLINQSLALDEWLGHASANRLYQKLQACPLGQDRITTLDALLVAAVAHEHDPALRHLSTILDAIEQAEGQMRVEDLAQQLHLHYTTLYRLFKAHLGIAPKLYLDLVRYSVFVSQLIQTNGTQMLLASLEGYYDQAHASKEFRRFTSVTPQTFKSTLNSIAKLMYPE